MLPVRSNQVFGFLATRVFPLRPIPVFSPRLNFIASLSPPPPLAPGNRRCTGIRHSTLRIRAARAEYRRSSSISICSFVLPRFVRSLFRIPSFSLSPPQGGVGQGVTPSRSSHQAYFSPTLLILCLCVAVFDVRNPQSMCMVSTMGQVVARRPPVTQFYS